MLTCAQCGTQFVAHPYQRSLGFAFCGRECSGKHHSTTPRDKYERDVVRCDEGCWSWSGHVSTPGYGYVTKGTRKIQAHRLSWEIHNGPIPDGLCVLHRCDNRLCTRPDHLFLGTKADNSADMVAKDRSTRGSRNPKAKLTEELVVEARARYVKGVTRIADLAAEIGVSRRCLTFVLSRKTWKHV